MRLEHVVENSVDIEHHQLHRCNTWGNTWSNHWLYNSPFVEIRQTSDSSKTHAKVAEFADAVLRREEAPLAALGWTVGAKGGRLERAEYVEGLVSLSTKGMESAGAISFWTDAKDDLRGSMTPLITSLLFYTIYYYFYSILFYIILTNQNTL